MSYASEVIADSPYLYWKLDETAGTQATDDSGNARHGTYSGDYALDRSPLMFKDVGRSVLFNPTGADDGVARLNPVAGFPTTDITLECWLDGTSVANNPVLLNYESGADVNDLLVQLNTSGDVRIYINGSFVDSAPAGLNDGLPHHLVVSWRSSDGQVLVYKDGSLFATLAVGAAASLAGGGSFAIAHHESAPGVLHVGTRWEGKLDHVAVYGFILGADRVAVHYELGIIAGSYPLAVIADAPDFHWRLGEAAGTTAVDETDAGNDGTYAGDFVLGAPGLVNDADDAVTLNGTGGANGDGRIEIGSYTWPNANNAYFEMWIKSTETIRTLLSYATGTGDSAKEVMVEQDVVNGRVVLRLHRGASSIDMLIDKPNPGVSPLEDGNPHHLVVLVGGAGVHSFLLLDGVKYGFQILGIGGIVGGGTLMFGVAQTDSGVVDTASGVSFQGVIDEASVVNINTPF